MIEKFMSPMFLAAVFFAFYLCSCESLKRAAAPIVVFEERLCESPPESGGQGYGVEFVAVNLSGRPVKKVSFRIGLYEKSEDDGQDDSYGGAFYEKIFELDGPMDSGQEERLFVPLEDLDPNLDLDAYELDYVKFVSGDGSE